jgi:GNAT superfamily N-acetyltransferase
MEKDGLVIMVIRKADHGEIPKVVDAFKVFEESSDFVKVDRAYAIKTYRKLIESGMGGVLLLEDRGVLHGGLGYIFSVDLHFPRKIAIETFWFVLPQYRGKGVALLNAFEELAVQEGCAQIAMVHLADSFPERLRELYLRRGYELMESHYVKELS